MAAVTGPTNPPGKLVLLAEHWERMRDEVSRLAPEEACGLLGGRGERVETVIPVPNALRSPVHFRMVPEEQLAAFLEIERAGRTLIGIYHSHPRGPDRPSPTDVAEAYYPEAVALIWSGAGGEWNCRGFQIVQGRIREVPLVREDE